MPGYIYQVNGEKHNSGWNTNPDTVDLSGYHGMYLANKTEKGGYYWWLASPSARTAVVVCYVYGSGSYLDVNHVGNASGVCPVVSLKSGVRLDIVDED